MRYIFNQTIPIFGAPQHNNFPYLQSYQSLKVLVKLKPISPKLNLQQPVLHLPR